MGCLGTLRLTLVLPPYVGLGCCSSIPQLLCRYTSLRDLLRVVRNKRTHFYEMPPETQAQMGPLPDGFLQCVYASWSRLPHGFASSITTTQV